MQNNAFWCLDSEIEYYDNFKRSYGIYFIIEFVRLAAGWEKVDYLIIFQIIAVRCWENPKYWQNDSFYELKLTIQLIVGLYTTLPKQTLSKDKLTETNITIIEIINITIQIS